MMRMAVFLLVFLTACPVIAGHGGKHVFVTINGLVCDFCARSMEKVFLKREQVSDIKVDLTTKVVTIGLKQDSDLTDADIQKSITDAGYTVVGIKRD